MEIENRICKKCQQNFELDQDDFSFYEKMKVPVLEICPDCRFKMRAIWRNEMSLCLGRKCDKCEKNIKTNYSPKRYEALYCEYCYKQEVY